MAEPTLALGLADVQAKLGSYAGWGRGVAFGDPIWPANQQAYLDDAVQSGSRRFYYPEPLPGEKSSYDWSFMKPVATLTFPAGQQAINLPDDFGAPEGPVTVLASGTTTMPWPIQWRNESWLREQYSVIATVTGPPQYAAVAPLKGTSGTVGQRFQLLLFPLTDQAYQLQLAYYVNPDALTLQNPYPWGGAAHAETFLESCLAVLEERLDDEPGPHAMAFQKRLLASISMDRKVKPQKLGPNLDRSDTERTWDRWAVHWYAPAATYNGVSFD